MKKTIVLILAFVMCVSLLSACGGGGAAETKPAADGGVFTYTYENGVLTISGKGVLDYDGMEASGAANVLQSATEAVHVVLEEGVTEIGRGAFSTCGALASVTLPESVTEIGENAFIGCGLTSVTIPGSVAKIGDRAFLSCGTLTSATIQDGVTAIGDSAFASCGALTSVTIPMSVTEIGEYAFLNCSLTSVTIPNPGTVIAENSFDSGVTINQG